MFLCFLCNRPATLLRKPSNTTSYINCGYCKDYLVDDGILKFSKSVRDDCASYSNQHIRYRGETIYFYRITRTYKIHPNKIVVLSCRTLIP